MHFEFLVEDQSGKAMPERLVPKIIDDSKHTFQIHAYKGIGRIPKNLNQGSDPEKRILLDRLPKLLAGYGRTFANYPPDYRAAVIVVCDLDRRTRADFEMELRSVLEKVNPAPETRFCLAIEEGEAWFLGDREAVLAAYPRAKIAVLDSYEQDKHFAQFRSLLQNDGTTRRS